MFNLLKVLQYKRIFWAKKDHFGARGTSEPKGPFWPKKIIMGPKDHFGPKVSCDSGSGYNFIIYTDKCVFS